MICANPTCQSPNSEYLCRGCFSVGYCSEECKQPHVDTCQIGSCYGPSEAMKHLQTKYSAFYDYLMFHAPELVHQVIKPAEWGIIRGDGSRAALILVVHSDAANRPLEQSRGSIPAMTYINEHMLVPSVGFPISDNPVRVYPYYRPDVIVNMSESSLETRRVKKDIQYGLLQIYSVSSDYTALNRAWD